MKFFVKTEITDFINNYWQEYGYKAKPDKYIALSFDDGPCPPSCNGGTKAMLETLEKLNVKATFFVNGNYVRENQDEAKAIFNNGHELANHSDKHDHFADPTPFSVAEITGDLNATSLAIKEITGELPPLFRAPYLDNGINLRQACADLNMALIGGSGEHKDWQGTGHTPESIKNSVLSNPLDGDIIIIHENNTSEGDTMAALPGIISGLREKGFWIMTVGQLVIIKESELKPGIWYDRF